MKYDYAMNIQTRAMSSLGKAILSSVLILSPLPLAGQVTFTDVTSSAGVVVTGDLTGDANNESLAWGDIDRDGDEDLYLTVDGPNQLFENNGNGTFTDISSEAGVDNAQWGVGAAFGDLDNDGDLDLYVVNFGAGADLLYRNDGPNDQQVVTFTNVAAAAGINIDRSSRGMAFLDYDKDSLLDIYVNSIGADILYHNLGGLTFADVAKTACGPGAPSCIEANNGQGVGVVATDVDGNGWIDLYTGNRSFDPNRLFLNQDGVFTDVTFGAGVGDIVGFGMGVLSFDADNDLDFDLYWTAWPEEPNALYLNQGGGPLTFLEDTAASGTLDATGWGISTNSGDVDNDGWEDFFVTNGFDNSSGANVLFRNDGPDLPVTGGGPGPVTFSDITASALSSGASIDGRGVAFADFDNDGDLDMCVTDGNSAGFPETGTRLYRNDTVNSNHWLVLKLLGIVSNRSAIGARVEVETDLDTQVKEVSGGAGRGSQNSLPLEFGLGQAAEIVEIRIRWPNGFEDTLTDIAMDQIVTVLESAVFLDGFKSGDLSAWALAQP